MSRELKQALPELVAGLESALAHVGRGELAAQLSRASIEQWRYDDFADATTLVLLPGAQAAERLSLWDELGVNIDLDERGRPCALEVLDGGRIVSLLEHPT